MLSSLTCYIKNHPYSLFKASTDSFFEKSADHTSQTILIPKSQIDRDSLNPITGNFLWKSPLLIPLTVSHLSLTISEFNSISNCGIFPERIVIYLQQIIPNTLCTKIRGKKRNRITVITPLAESTQKSCYKTLRFITALILHL